MVWKPNYFKHQIVVVFIWASPEITRYQLQVSAMRTWEIMKVMFAMKPIECL